MSDNASKQERCGSGLKHMAGINSTQTLYNAIGVQLLHEHHLYGRMRTKNVILNVV